MPSWLSFFCQDAWILAFLYFFIYLFSFFLAITKSRLIKTHALKKERGQYPISTPMLTQSERGRALGSRLGQYPVILTEKVRFITWPKTELYIVQGTIVSNDL